ncbi:MAG: hypothetical protein EOS41_12905 [Mesorhizobium sp.]|uniref:hypothetical protein n=1 Tax=Mesorhizobium sp. TaxID=1871066 RepID=UPI000FE78CDB|nr:hypothetical protein [Mesorhizobium sp.]RWE25109.1 MAG: hypothetical protein EOS41_12905 [Mesorhizobium sp.]
MLHLTRGAIRGGIPAYQSYCDEVAADGYKGFQIGQVGSFGYASAACMNSEAEGTIDLVTIARGAIGNAAAYDSMVRRW